MRSATPRGGAAGARRARHLRPVAVPQLGGAWRRARPRRGPRRQPRPPGPRPAHQSYRGGRAAGAAPRRAGDGAGHGRGHGGCVGRRSVCRLARRRPPARLLSRLRGSARAALRLQQPGGSGRQPGTRGSTERRPRRRSRTPRTGEEGEGEARGAPCGARRRLAAATGLARTTRPPTLGVPDVSNRPNPSPSPTSDPRPRAIPGAYPLAPPPSGRAGGAAARRRLSRPRVGHNATRVCTRAADTIRAAAYAPAAARRCARTQSRPLHPEAARAVGQGGDPERRGGDLERRGERSSRRRGGRDQRE